MIDQDEELKETHEEKIKMKQSDGSEIETTCFGDIEFKETTKSSKGKFIRFSDKTDPEKIFKYMKRCWQLRNPNLLISVTGGAKTLSMDPWLKENFKLGLLKIAGTTGTWVISGGTNTGVMKLVGDALSGTTNTCIGIVTWGIIANKESLTSKLPGSSFPYHLGSYLLKEGVAFLDYNHNYFLLVDNGTEGQFGKEIEFRAKFEEHITQPTGQVPKVPSVLLVLEGGPGTLNTIYQAVIKENPIPICLVKGSGKTADLLIYALSESEQILERRNANEQHSTLDKCIENTFIDVLRRIGDDEKKMKVKNKYYNEVIACVEKKNAFNVVQISQEMDLDDTILTALLKDKQTSSYEQMKLTLLWDRVDLAESKIMAPMSQWEGKPVELEWLMIMALAMNRIAFVKLLLDYGVSIKSLLTKEVLEFLYAYRSRINTSPPSPLKYMIPKNSYTLGDSESKHKRVFLELLLDEGIEIKYAAIKRNAIEELINKLCSRFIRTGNEDFIEILDPDSPNAYFINPFCELFFWAVLNNICDMAQLLWGFEGDAMAKALIASEVCNSLFERAAGVNLQDELEKSLKENARIYNGLAIQLLEECYRTDEPKTKKLITSQLSVFNNITCLELAIYSYQKEFVSDDSVQSLLNSVWEGRLDTGDVQTWKIFLTFWCPILWPILLGELGFRTKEEMTNMGIINVVEAETKLVTETAEMDDAINNIDRLPAKHYGTFESVVEEQEKRKQISFIEKINIFYFKTPFIKFHQHLVGYLLFLALFAYVAMLKKDSTVLGPWEILLIITVAGYFVGEIYQISQIDTPSFKAKMTEYLHQFWNLLDTICILLFIIAVILRLNEKTLHVGHLVYAIDCYFFIIRILHVLYIHPISGPYVVMIGYMFRDMGYFIIILFVFLIAHGITMKAILLPDEGTSQMFSYSVFHPYFNIFGELFIDRDRENGTTRFGTPASPKNAYVEPMAWLSLAIYLFMANILLLNVLIAVFNNTFQNVMQSSLQIWRFERYELVVEYYQQRVMLFPPFSLPRHFYLFFKWLYMNYCCTCICGYCCDACKRNRNSNGLKYMVPEGDPEGEIDDLKEFENICLTTIMRTGIETKPLNEVTSDILQRIEESNENMKKIEGVNEDISTKIEGIINTKMTSQLSSLIASVEERLKKIEMANEDITSKITTIGDMLKSVETKNK